MENGSKNERFKCNICIYNVSFYISELFLRLAFCRPFHGLLYIFYYEGLRPPAHALVGRNPSLSYFARYHGLYTFGFANARKM